MVAISRKLEQRKVTRRYYHGEIIPTPKDFVDTVRKNVQKIQGFELVDVAGGPGEDKDGIKCFIYVALFQRDGTTLEAKKSIAMEMYCAHCKKRIYNMGNDFDEHICEGMMV